MLVRVDLACEKCRKKIKKVLCDIPQIQNQAYNEKDNLFLITVVCCSPEKVKKKICCKGGKTVKGIEILKPKKKDEPKPKEPEKPKPPPETPKEPKKKDESKDAPKPPERAITVVEPPPPKAPGPAEPPPKALEPAPKPHELVHVAPGPTCCRECYEGYGRGPCWGGYGGPSGPCYGRPVYDSWGGGYWRPIYPSRRPYICEENPNAACSIM